MGKFMYLDVAQPSTRAEDVFDAVLRKAQLETQANQAEARLRTAQLEARMQQENLRAERRQRALGEAARREIDRAEIEQRREAAKMVAEGRAEEERGHREERVGKAEAEQRRVAAFAQQVAPPLGPLAPLDGRLMEGQGAPEQPRAPSALMRAVQGTLGPILGQPREVPPERETIFEEEQRALAQAGAPLREARMDEQTARETARRFLATGAAPSEAQQLQMQRDITEAAAKATLAEREAPRLAGEKLAAVRKEHAERAGKEQRGMKEAAVLRAVREAGSLGELEAVAGEDSTRGFEATELARVSAAAEKRGGQLVLEKVTPAIRAAGSAGAAHEAAWNAIRSSEYGRRNSALLLSAAGKRAAEFEATEAKRTKAAAQAEAAKKELFALRDRWVNEQAWVWRLVAQEKGEKRSRELGQRAAEYVQNQAAAYVRHGGTVDNLVDQLLKNQNGIAVYAMQKTALEDWQEAAAKLGRVEFFALEDYARAWYDALAKIPR